MTFNFNKSIEILSRTPPVLETMLLGLSEDWTHNNEGENTWSAFDIVGHLIHADKTDWIPRMNVILSNNPDKHFPPFDRFAHLDLNKDKTLAELLNEFKTVRKNNIEVLIRHQPAKEDLDKKGVHPEFGDVTLSQLLSTWTVHDLAHLAQIARVMAKQYSVAVGPWKEYLSVLKK